MSVMVTQRIDRIDQKGNIREHIVHPRDPDKTLCGLVIGTSQRAMGNRVCQRCEVEAALRAWTSKKRTE
jgi:hypothetical protein